MARRGVGEERGEIRVTVFYLSAGMPAEAVLFVGSVARALAGIVPVAILEYLLLAQTAVVVVVAVKTVGVVLVSSFIVIPAASARIIATTFSGATIAALVIGTAGAWLGLVASYHLNTAAAATIILIHSAGFAGSLIYARLRR